MILPTSFGVKPLKHPANPSTLLICPTKKEIRNYDKVQTDKREEKNQCKPYSKTFGYAKAGFPKNVVVGFAGIGSKPIYN